MISVWPRFEPGSRYFDTLANNGWFMTHLVAPVTDHGMKTREVYLPAGAEWYNYWTNERFTGGQTIRVNAPIETIPLFVRRGRSFRLARWSSIWVCRRN
jgi:hypothetical protein